jgi:NAD-dependent SIR2 family protein deacetylase
MMAQCQSPSPKTVVFLGAGASCADGAPLQANLFRDYFRHCYTGSRHSPDHIWDSELAAFFRVFYGIDVDNRANVKTAMFPTFEEVLGVLEIADSQGESFRDWGTSHIDQRYTKPRIQHMHEVLILLIAEILNCKLKRSARNHPALVQQLGNAGVLKHTTFISLNYDILMDNALLQARDSFHLDLDYSIEFVNFGGEWARPMSQDSVKLLKLHGSLNWLYCPTCRTIRITPKVKGVCLLKWRPGECVCKKCGTLAVPIVIPPTYFKALSNLYLREIWHAAEQALMECDRIVFCGYSFPDADVHIRYLLKRVEVNSQRTPAVYVVNEHTGKKKGARDAEQQRYVRFFQRKSMVYWTQLSFEDFCHSPESIQRFNRPIYGSSPRRSSRRPASRARRARGSK